MIICFNIYNKLALLLWYGSLTCKQSVSKDKQIEPRLLMHRPIHDSKLPRKEPISEFPVAILDLHDTIFRDLA